MAIFSIVSTWSFAKILGTNIVYSYTTTFLLVWVWSILWTTKSSTYRSGLFTGLVLAWGSMINIHYIYLLPVTLIFVYFKFMQDKTTWYRRQWLKYNLLGVLVSLIVISTHFEVGKLFSGVGFKNFYYLVEELIYRKAFYILSLFGFFLLAFNQFGLFKKYLSFVVYDKEKINELVFCILTITIFGLTLSNIYIEGFSYLWIIAFLSLIPLEWIFQSISRLRSKRNIIYTLYILVCLLDSHFEGRIRIIGKMFLEDEVYKYINQM